MKNKKECEIVQDLLINYTDDILNPESKKLVEGHLIQCKECQERLKHVREDIKDNDNKEQIEIDYLKKIRIKTRIKSILIALGIILAVFIIMFLNSFIKINIFMNKAEKSLQANNFYKETSQIMSDNKTIITKEYYKDGKYKSVSEVYTDEGVEVSSIRYANANSDERIYIYENEKKAIIEKGEISKIVNSSNNIKSVPFVSARNSLIPKIGMAFICSVNIDTYDYGKEYYILKNRMDKNDVWEIWIDKETGLPIKEINRNGEKIFFAGTDVVKEIRDNIQEYKYKFNEVTDKDVQEPNLSDYTIENKSVNMKDIIEN